MPSVGTRSSSARQASSCPCTETSIPRADSQRRTRAVQRSQAWLPWVKRCAPQAMPSSLSRSKAAASSTSARSSSSTSASVSTTSSQPSSSASPLRSAPGLPARSTFGTTRTSCPARCRAAAARASAAVSSSEPSSTTTMRAPPAGQAMHPRLASLRSITAASLRHGIRRPSFIAAACAARAPASSARGRARCRPGRTPRCNDSARRGSSGAARRPRASSTIAPDPTRPC